VTNPGPIACANRQHLLTVERAKLLRRRHRTGRSIAAEVGVTLTSCPWLTGSLPRFHSEFLKQSWVPCTEPISPPAPRREWHRRVERRDPHVSASTVVSVRSERIANVVVLLYLFGTD
jgi:hypothetical protein